YVSQEAGIAGSQPHRLPKLSFSRGKISGLCQVQSIIRVFFCFCGLVGGPERWESRNQEQNQQTQGYPAIDSARAALRGLFMWDVGIRTWDFTHDTVGNMAASHYLDHCRLSAQNTLSPKK